MGSDFERTINFNCGFFYRTLEEGFFERKTQSFVTPALSEPEWSSSQTETEREGGSATA